MRSCIRCISVFLSDERGYLLLSLGGGQHWVLATCGLGICEATLLSEAFWNSWEILDVKEVLSVNVHGLFERF